MSQHDYNLANQSGSSFRTDLNNALLAIVSGNSGAEPSSKFAYMIWNDSSNNLRKIRNANNTDWVTIGTLTGGNVFADDVTFTGASANILWDKSTDDLIFDDNAKAIFGNGSDGLEIYHSGTNSYIADTGTGALIFRSDLFSFRNDSDTKQMAQFIQDAGVILYYNDDIKFATLNIGVEIPSGEYLLVGRNTTFDDQSQAAVQIDGGGAAGLAIMGSSTASQSRISFFNPNGRVGSIQTNGSATVYSTSSDYRLKENATAISDGITRLKTLKPYRFNFKADPTKTVDGFFAHEVTAVPEAITGEKDGDAMQGIDQSKLVPLLTAALQEVEARVSALEGS
jgi:hypothetical protein